MTMANLFNRPSGKFLAERWRLFFLKENENTKKKKKNEDDFIRLISRMDTRKNKAVQRSMEIIQIETKKKEEEEGQSNQQVRQQQMV